MMESSNLNLDLHHQEDFHGSSSSSLAIPWNQDLCTQNNTHDISMVQELGLQWTPTCINGTEGYLMNQEDYSSKINIKGDQLGINLQDYSMIPSHVKHEGNQIDGLILPSFEPLMNLGNDNNGLRGCFSMVLPSASVCSLNYLNGFYNTSSSLGLTTQASLNNMAKLMREDLAYDGTGTLGHLEEPTHAAVPPSHHKVSHSPSVRGVTEAKRGLDCKITSQPPSKKPRLESRASFTPFKVRKEKLGDRIAALQQLVAPFGKTDTASVLMEAIGYIKFLQGQVETLSVPYMNSSNNKMTGSSQGGSSEEREQKPDLRSRGLCLVPLSCMSYVTNDHNGGVWQPNNYRGGS